MGEKLKGKPRSRISVSCTECKRRKVKCDRRLPCSACVRHHASRRCGYFDNQIVTPVASLPGQDSVYSAFHQKKYGRHVWQNRTYGPAYSSAEELYHANGSRDLENSTNRTDRENAHRQAPAPPKPDDYVAHFNSPHSTSFPDPVPAVPFIPTNYGYPPPGAMPLPGNSYPIEAAYQPPPPAQIQAEIPTYQGPGPNYYTMLPSDFPHTFASQVQGHNGPPASAGNHVGNLGSDDMNRDSGPFYNPPASTNHSQVAPGIPQGIAKGQDKPAKPEILEKPANFVEPPAKVSSQYPEVPAVRPVNRALLLDDISPPVRINPVTSLLNEDFPPVKERSTTWIGENPHDTSDPDENFDIFGGYNPIYTEKSGNCISHGPFSWYAYVCKDIALKCVCAYIKATFEKNKNFEIPKMFSDLDCPKGSTQAANYTPNSFSQNSVKGDFKKRLLSLGLTFYEGDVDSSICLADRIKLMLPSKKAVSFFVNHFFEVIYPYLPILDEKYFRKHIQRIIGPFSDSDEPYTEIRVTRRCDYAHLGILLLLLRATYLSALSNEQSENENFIANEDTTVSEKSRFTLNNPINIDVMHCAQLCLNQYSLYERTNLTVLQCAVMIRAYLSVSPESGDATDGYEDNSFNVTCIQIAHCMGLNRDPSGIHELKPNPSCDHLKRKLWHFVKYSDTRSAYHFGSPVMLDDESHDTKVPYYSPGCSHVANESLEKAACEGMKLVAFLNNKARVILMKSTSLKTPLQVRKLTALVSDLEMAMNSELGTLSELMSAPSDTVVSSYKKVYRLRVYLIMKSFILAILYHLFLNYEKAKKFDLSFFYLRKYVSITSGDFLVHAVDLMRKGEHFQLDTWVPGLIINPVFLNMMQRTNHINLRLIVQLNCMISKMERSGEMKNADEKTQPEFHSKLARARRLSLFLETSVRYSTCCLLMLGHRSFFSWRMSKIHSSFLQFASSSVMPEFCSEEEPNFIPLTDHRMKELLDIIEQTCAKVRQKGQCDPTNIHKPGLSESENKKIQFSALKANSAAKPEAIEPKKGERDWSSAYDSENLLSRKSNQVGGNPGYTAEESDYFLSTDFVNLDLGNVEEIDNVWSKIGSMEEVDKLWQQIGSMDDIDGFWQRIKSAKDEPHTQHNDQQAKFGDKENGSAANGHRN